MAKSYDWKDLVMSALRAHFLERLQSHALSVEIGWPGDLKPNRPLLTLEAGSGEYEEAPVSIARFHPKDQGALAPVMGGEGVIMGAGADVSTAVTTLSYGEASFPLFANLWVKGGLDARAIRSRLLRAIQIEAFDYRRGRSRQIDLILDNESNTRARVFVEGDAETSDSPEGVRRDEWRGRLSFTAVHDLEVETELPIANEILIRPEIDRLAEGDFSLAGAMEDGL